MDSGQLHVGRIVFAPDVWRIQTLHNHVNNVVRLVELWDAERDFLHSSDRAVTRPHLLRADHP